MTIQTEQEYEVKSALPALALLWSYLGAKYVASERPFGESVSVPVNEGWLSITVFPADVTGSLGYAVIYEDEVRVEAQADFYDRVALGFFVRNYVEYLNSVKVWR